MTRTPLTYYGGKQLLAAQIVAMMPPHRVYLEPFAGGAAVLFAKRRCERETINDLDQRVMRVWRVLRERPDDLARAVALTPYSRQEWRDSRDPTEDDLLVEIDQSFSRSRSSWSVPCIGDGRGRWQPDSWGNLPEKIATAAERLSGVALENRDALAMIPRWDRADAVIYCDPPYAGPLRTEPTKGYRHDAPDLMDRLVDVLLGVRYATVILSGYPCAAAERLGWRDVPLDRKRTVQSRAGGELAAAPEVVWLSPQVPEPNVAELWTEYVA